MRLAGAKRGKGVPRRSGGVSEAERGRPVAEQVRACGHLPYLWVGDVFGRVQRLITCGGKTCINRRCLALNRAENGHRWGGVTKRQPPYACSIANKATPHAKSACVG